jgi:23S rRNA pseudouridine2604 synthase
MAERKKLQIKPQAPPRDPRRRPVRALTAPHRPPASRGDHPGHPARAEHPGRPPSPHGPRDAPRSPRAKMQTAPRPKAPMPTANRPAPTVPPHPPAPLPSRTEPASHPAVATHARPPLARPSAVGVRVAKLITERGIASRREADEWIAAGWVRCEGRVAVLGQRVAPDAAIEIDPRARRAQARRVTVLLNKPLGYVSGQAEDGYEPASVLVTPANRWGEDPSRVPLHAGQLRGLAPAGRLDIDSTGLLVLTQDGRIAKLLIGEHTRVEKEYLVRVRAAGERPLAETDLGLLRHGLELDGQALKPAQVSWANEDQLRFVLREGRKRQIRRMCELVGLQVVALKRVRIGSVVLGALPPGQWRLLGEHERF